MEIGEELRWRVMDMPNPALENESGECRHDAETGCSWRCERRTGNAVTPEQVRDYIRERVGPALFAVLDGFGEELKSITMVGCEHADALAKADRTIATLRKALPTWIPVEERLPVDDEYRSQAVLVWCPERMNNYAAYMLDGEWFVFGSGAVTPLTQEVTHWQPLPGPPAALDEVKP